MKTAKDEDSTVDVTGSASKKMKQARLPFKLLTPKVADKKNKEENADKDRAQSEKPGEEVVTDKTAKENAITDEVIVLEDSVEMTDEFKNKSEPEKAPTRKRSISVSPPKKVAARKRQKTMKTDSLKSENPEQAEDSNPVSPAMTAKKLANESNMETKDEVEHDEAEQTKKTSPKKKSLKRNASALMEADGTNLSPTKPENSRRESPRKKKAKEEEEEESLRKGESPKKNNAKKDEEKESPRKGESPRKKNAKKNEKEESPRKGESPRKKNAKEDKEKESPRKGESPRKKNVEEEEKESPIKGDNYLVTRDVQKTIDDGRTEEDDKKSETESPTKREDEEEKKSPTKDGNSSKRQSSRVQSMMEQKNENNDSKSNLPKIIPKNESPSERNEVEGKKRDASTPASANKTPKARKLTPTQLEKQKESAKKKAEREEKQLEKERLRKEKEDQMNRLKEEKLKMKLDKEEQKRREKEEKEELKKKEKEEKEELRKKEKEDKEKKRLAEIEQKNEAKRQKEEEKKKQNEAREEERRKRDEAKEEEKRKKDAEKRKAAEAFASFFKTKEANSTATAEVEGSQIEMPVDELLKFMPFEVKGDMRLSTVCRRTLDPSTKSALDEKMHSQNADIGDLYIGLLKSKQHLPLTGEKTWPIADETDDDIIIIEAEVNEENGCEKTAREVHKEKRTKRFKAKLLQFEENRRPPYWGTWRKKSANIGARKPFNLDKTIFEYDVDSDEEWEEEEPGESLRGSDDENEKESEDEYEVDNKVFVPHGYLSDEEMQEDDLEDCSREAQKARLQLLEIEFQAEMTKKTEKLKPRLIGCVWFDNSVSDPSSVGSRIAEMLLSRRMVLFDSEVALPIEPKHRLSSNTESESPVASSPLVEQAGRKSKFPESAIPQLIKLVHGNQNKLSFLVREFSSYLTKNCQSTLDVPSMTAIRHKIRQLAKWMPFLAEDGATCPLAGKMCWYVGKDVREKYDLLLNDSELMADPWKYILPAPRKSVILPAAILDIATTDQSPKSASITKFTKKMTEEERKKQLLPMCTDSSPLSASSSPSIAAGKKTPSCKPTNLLATYVSLKGTPSHISDVITISPDKTDQESGKKISTEGAKPPVVKKRVQLTTLATFGVNSVTKKPDSTGLKKDDAETVNKETVTGTVQESGKEGSKFQVTEDKLSSNAEEVDETSSITKNKESSVIKEDETIVKDCTSTPDPMNISKSPEDFLGFQAIDSTKNTGLKDSLKTPQSKSKTPRSIASFFTKGSNKTTAKKLFDGKPAIDGSSEMKADEKLEETMSSQDSKTSVDEPKVPSQNASGEPEGLESAEPVPASDDVKVPTSPLQTPAKKRVQLTTLSPPKWRVKLAKPQPPPTSTSNNDDDDDDAIIVIE